MQKLPVFFHIPKNAGTYIYNRSFNIVKQLVNTKQKTYNLEVKKEGLTSYLIVCSSDKGLSDKYKVMNGASWVCVDYEDLQLDDLNLYFIEVCDQSFGLYKDDIYKKLNKDIKTFEFLSLRDPYERILSLFSYLKSAQSSHESTSGIFDGMEIVDYLNSDYLEGSWLIRNLLNIPNETPIIKQHFDSACEILDNFLISDIKNVDSLLSRVFGYCYGIKDCSTKQQEIYSNKTKIKVECDFDSLDQQTKDHFNNQTKWDRLLFEKYT
jgi:hypothetical protein